jgi:hypothetical protein
VGELHLLLRHWRELAEVWRWVWWSVTVAWVVFCEFLNVTNFGLLLLFCRWGGSRPCCQACGSNGPGSHCCMESAPSWSCH